MRAIILCRCAFSVESLFGEDPPFESGELGQSDKMSIIPWVVTIEGALWNIPLDWCNGQNGWRWTENIYKEYLRDFGLIM